MKQLYKSSEDLNHVTVYSPCLFVTYVPGSTLEARELFSSAEMLALQPGQVSVDPYSFSAWISPPSAWI